MLNKQFSLFKSDNRCYGMNTGKTRWIQEKFRFLFKKRWRFILNFLLIVFVRYTKLSYFTEYYFNYKSLVIDMIPLYV